jgi:hypothetical protein
VVTLPAALSLPVPVLLLLRSLSEQHNVINARDKHTKIKVLINN